MKQYIFKGMAVAAIAFISVPALAQKEKSKKEEKEKKEMQTIVITREGNIDEKTTIEINGEKVLINGKEPSKNENVNVNVHKFKTGDHGLSLSGLNRMGGNWDFNIDDERISLFSEDANRAMLGVVTDVDEKGAEITSVSKESAAEKAGLKKGDIITKIGDKKVEDAEDVSEAIREHKPGDKVAVTILRDGKEQKINAELGKWKGVNMSTIAPSRVYGDALPRVMEAPGAPGARTFYLRGNTPRLGLSIQDTEDGKGVKVIDVDDEGNAAKAGIEEDDVITHVNDKEVNNADEIAKMMRENKDNASVRMKVLRDGKTKNIEVRIPKKLKTADL